MFGDDPFDALVDVVRNKWAREHVTAAKNGTKTFAFGEHYKEEHPHTAPNIPFEVIQHASDVLRLQIVEAMAIQKHNPALNRKIEQLGTGYLP